MVCTTRLDNKSKTKIIFWLMPDFFIDINIIIQNYCYIFGLYSKIFAILDRILLQVTFTPPFSRREGKNNLLCKCTFTSLRSVKVTCTFALLQCNFTSLRSVKVTCTRQKQKRYVFEKVERYHYVNKFPRDTSQLFFKKCLHFLIFSLDFVTLPNNYIGLL